MADDDVAHGGSALPLSNEQGRAAVEFQALIETLPAAIYIATLEAESRILYMSPQAEQLFGLPVSDVRPARVREMLHPDDRERTVAALARANSVAGPATLEYRILRPDGSVVWLEDTSLVLPGAPGEPQRVQGYLLDISERKRLEEALLQSQKMDAVGQLAGGIAHDFNNILTAIQGFTEFALGRPAATGELREDLLEIRKAAARAATLTRQILAFGRRQVFHSRPVDLNDVIDDTKKLILRVIGEHIQVASRLEVPLGAVLADPSQIAQVLLNLAVNARDAMPDGGRLTIETGNADVDEVTAHSTGLEPGRYVVLRVTDTGTGMDAETARRAFEPFFTTKPVGAGTGLGLSTVYGIAQQSGGRASVYSEPGLGTVVRVHLPRMEGDPGVGVASERALDAGPCTGTILLVEDDDVIRTLTATMLERHGYDVLATGDPNEAVRLGADPTDIDLLLTDLVMPGMNGQELARRILAQRPAVRVLFTSGYPAGAIVGNALLEDGVPLLQKPFSSDALLDSVRQALG